MRKMKAFAIAIVLIFVIFSSWFALSYFGILGPQLELRVQTTDEIGSVNQLVGVNDYGPDVTELYGDQVAYDLFQTLGLQRLRVWCQFGSQLADSLGWGWHHTIFSGSTLADAKNPSFYNWTYLDLLFEVVSQTGAEPILTFTGCPRSLAQGGMPNKPPIDNTVYAEVVARVIMHYTEGWPGATGPIYPLDYVEIGNEPNFLPFWNATMQEFLDLYSVVSQRLEQLAGSFKIGGPGLADINLQFWTTNFLATVIDEDLPLDFFSWHAYHDDSSQVVQTIQTGKTLLTNQGFSDCECVFDEYGQSLSSDVGWETVQTAIHLTDVLIGAAKNGIDITCFALTKDAPVHPDLGGFFGEEANFGLLTRNPTTPKPTFHGLKPFAAIYGKSILDSTIIPLPALVLIPYPISFLAVKGEGQSNYTILISNRGASTINCRINLVSAPQATYDVLTRELSNMSISQYDDWTSPELVQTNDIIISIPRQSVLWINIHTTGSSMRFVYSSFSQVLQIATLLLIEHSKRHCSLKKRYYLMPKLRLF